MASAGARGVLQPATQTETLNALILADDPAATWFRPKLHGTSDDRVTALFAGTLQGTPSCTSPDFVALFIPPSERATPEVRRQAPRTPGPTVCPCSHL